jgi:hypothetical protein
MRAAPAASVFLLPCSPLVVGVPTVSGRLGKRGIGNDHASDSNDTLVLRDERGAVLRMASRTDLRHFQRVHGHPQVGPYHQSGLQGLSSTADTEVSAVSTSD